VARRSWAFLAAGIALFGAMRIALRLYQLTGRLAPQQAGERDQRVCSG
jgi:hypothetical protein